MKKHMKLVGIFGGVVVVGLLLWWAGWSFGTYDAANKYAGDLTKAWREQADIEREFKKLGEIKESYMQSWLNATTKVQMWASALLYRDITKENIKKSLIKVLVNDPEYFGFKEDKADAKAVQEWTEVKADGILENLGDRLGGILEELEKTATAAPSPTPAPTPTVPAPAAPAVPATPASTTPPAPASTAPVTPTTPAPTVPVAPAPTPTPTVPPAPPVPAAPTTKVVVKEVAPGVPESAIPQAGDGVERIFQRQLDPTQKLVFLNDKGEKVDLSFVGDAADKLAVKDWKGQTANKIAVLHGYFDPKTGNEVRIRAPGIVAYVLVTEDDKLAGVKECRKNPEGKFGVPEYTRLQETAKSYAAAQFKGSVDGGIQSYEYLWTPQMKSEKPSINAASISSLPSQTISASSLISQIDTIDLVLNSQGQFQIATVFGLWG